MTVDTRGLIDREQLKPFERLVIFQKIDNPDAPWAELQNSVEITSGSVQVALTHFSSYAVDSTGNESNGWQLKFNPPAIGLFSGAATYNYPIQISAGRNGLQPNVVLAYSSRSVDGLVGLNDDDTDGLPPGWALDEISIARNGIKTNWDGANNHLHLPDKFSVTINGTGYDLVPANPTAYCGQYYAKDAAWLYVQRLNDLCRNGTTNYSHEYWIVKAGDGTTYRLGYNSDAEQTIRQNAGFATCDGYCGATCVTDGYCSGGAARWRVDTITDVVGSQIMFTFFTHSTTDSNTQPITSEHTRPQYIDYNYVSSTATSRIEFASTGGAVNWIDRIYVYNTSTTNKIREYRLALTYNTSANMYIHLDSITQYSGSGSQSLPPTSFTYADLVHAPSGGSYVPAIPYVTRINNGYGGATEFSYVSDGRAESHTSDNNGPIWSYGYSYYVIEMRTYDGINSNPAKVQYAYGVRCYDQTGNHTLVKCTGANPQQDGPLVGHDVVTQTVLALDGVTTLSRDVHYFNIDNNNAPLRGRELSTKSLDPANGFQALQQIVNTYITTTVPTTVTYFQQANTTRYADGLAITQCVSYTYNTYGNVVQTFNLGDPLTTADDSMNQSLYYPNLTGWVVNKPGYTNVYSWTNGQWSLAKSTIFSYDNHPEYYTPVITGQLTAVRAWTGVSPTLFIDTVYTYDQWGNPVTETTFDGVGTASAYATSNPRSITTTYDSTYHLYPIKVTNAKGYSATTTYSYTFGLPLTVTDLNGVVTSYTYDPFGRLKRVIKPGDSPTYPTDQYYYYDGGDGEYPLTAWPLQVVHIQRRAAGDGCSGGWGGWERTYYDGLGRVVQRHTPMQDWTCTSGQMAVQYTLYNAVGQVSEQSVPYAVVDTATNGYSHYQPPDRSKPTTKTAYDALGRTTVITAADGKATTQVYGLMTENNINWNYHTVIDANRHRRDEVLDALGRLVKVKEFDGNCGQWSFSCAGSYTTSWVAYANTQYAYDVVGNLRVVTDTALSTTKMNYDTLGRKTEMFDPDMGHWTYQYDTAGNLITQTDAIGNVLWFKYDVLNRLVEKRQTGSGGSWRASYAYDTGVNGIGRRTAMTDTTGNTAWTYDQRGRVTNESKTIAGTAYTTGYAYDAMDRVTSTVYPDTGHETVVQTYNAASQLTSVSGLSTYANNLTYNALGQLTQMNYSPNILATWGYWGTGGARDSSPGTGLANFGRLWRQRVQDYLGNPRYDVRYNYDNVGNVTRMQEAPRSATNWPTGDIFSDTFNTKDLSNWAWSAYQTVSGGLVQSTGTGVNWNAALARTAYSLASATSLQVRFQVNATNTSSVYAIEANDTTYRRFGVVADAGKLTAQYNDGGGYIQPIDLISNLQTNTWYVLRISLDDSGGFYMEAYPESNPAVRGSYTRLMTAGKTWRFHHWIYRGTAYLDDYRESSPIPFDTRNTVSWAWSAYQTVPFRDTDGNNVVKSTGTTVDYNAHFYRSTYSLTSGKGLQVRFKVDATNTSSVYAIEANDATYRRFGVVADAGKLTVQYNDGSGYVQPVDLLPTLQTNTWYVLRIVVDDTARGFYVEAYQESNPTLVRGSYTQELPVGKSWRFHHWIYRGTAYLDDYFEFSTSGLAWNADERLNFSYDAQDRLYDVWPDAGAQGYNDGYRYYANGNFYQKGNIYYSYDAAHPHAVTQLNGVQKFWYDANGNMITRTEGSTIYTQQWDVENRLTVVTNTATNQVTQFYYDGDGNRVKKIGPTQTIWVEDALPTGASGSSEGGDTWSWTTSQVGSRQQAHVSANVAGQHQHYFSGAANPLSVTTSDQLIQYVYIPSGSVPQEIMLQWFDGTWEHRAYWGCNCIAWGTDGTVSRKSMGPIPAQRDQWIKLTVPASAVGLEGRNVVGWAYTLYTGSIYWDASGLERPTTTVYVGNLYEKNLSTAVETSYYFAGDKRLAMRQGGVLTYLVADHLGSSSVALDASGNKVGEERYKPFGEQRWGTVPTDRRFTGQRSEEASLGSLYDYGARFYSPYLNRWIQPDAIVPDFANPQQLNRFSYTLNNPLKYIDPSGHCITNNKTKDGGYEQTRGDYFDCSIDELKALEWDARSWWIGQLGAAGGSAGWFKNIQTVLAFFRNTPGLNDLNGWASTADAPLLWVIQEGYRSYANPNYVTDTTNPLLRDAAKAWAEFFGSQKEDAPARISRWGQAEILGTRAGEDIANGLVARPTGEAGAILAHFLYIGDNYRQYLATGSCNCDLLHDPALFLGLQKEGATDPRTDNVKYGIALAVFRGDVWWNLVYIPASKIFGGSQ